MREYDKYNMYVHSDFTKHFNCDGIRTIVEVGARDGIYTNDLLDYYPNCEVIHSFECNPYAIKQCYENMLNNRIIFNNIALSYTHGLMPLYPQNRLGDSGSTSQHQCEADKPYYLTDKILVPCCTLDWYCSVKTISKIDLLLLDVEGGEYNILDGAKDSLKFTDVIITEAWNVQKYTTLIKLQQDIVNYLKPYGFKLCYTTCKDYFGDAVFVKEK